MAMKRPLQRSKTRRRNKFGFRSRMKTNSGRKVLQRRRTKGRAVLAA